MPAQEPQVQELIRTLTSLAGELEVKIFQQKYLNFGAKYLAGSSGQNQVE